MGTTGGPEDARVAIYCNQCQFPHHYTTTSRCKSPVQTASTHLENVHHDRDNTTSAMLTGGWWWFGEVLRVVLSG